MYDTYQEIFSLRGNAYHDAMAIEPTARDEEFLNAVRLLDLSDGEVLVDFPSGGGYLQQYLPESVQLIQGETCQSFFDQLKPEQSHKTFMGDFESIPLESDAAGVFICLAALHHVADVAQFFSEVTRVLRNDGQFLVADVVEGSNIAEFLNTFVDQHNSMGHHGVFLSSQTLQIAQEKGLKCQAHEVIDFDWKFRSEKNMLDFCRGLFGLDLANDERIKQGIHRYLVPRKKGEHFYLRWQLAYIKFGLAGD